VLRLQHETLHRIGLPCRVVKIKGALCFDVIVAVGAQAVVFADEHFGAAAGELRCGELRFVVLLKCWDELCVDVVAFED
jgi:hypothetical protein